MDKPTFLDYCEAYSGEDKASAFDRFYDPDATFSHPLKGTFHGREAIVGFWTQGHPGIHEVLDPTNILILEDRIAAEFKIKWHCFADSDYLGPRKKGEVYDSSCSAFYHLKDDKFVRVTIYQGPYSR